MADFDPDQQNTQPTQEQPVQFETNNQQSFEPQKQGNKLTRNSSHPVALIITILFALWPLAYGLVSIFFKQSMLTNYIVSLVGIALTFYHNKNFAGRYLSKLRYFTYVVDGKTYYYFEAGDKQSVRKFDNFVFWTCIWIIPIYYIVLTIAYALTVQWLTLPVTIVGAICGVVNLAAYIRCHNDYKKKAKDLAVKFGQQAVQQQLNL